MARPAYLQRCALALIVLSCGWAQAASTGTTSAISTFLYPPSGLPVPVEDLKTFGLVNGPLASESWQTGHADPHHAGGYAFAKGSFVASGFGGEDLQLGTAVFARSRGPFSGSASARVDAKYIVEVEIGGPRGDPLLSAIWLGTLPGSTCNTAGGCVLETSFVHFTHGRLAYSVITDQEARFEERLSMGTVTVGGAVGVRFNPFTGRAGPIAPTDDWIGAGLTAFGPTPMDQLGLFPAGDPRNSVEELSGFDFRHFAHIDDQLAPFRVGVNRYDEIVLKGLYELNITQIATAGPGTNYINSTLAVDFANTSTFSLDHVIDPSGQIDLSLATVSMTFSTPVPEPATWLLWLAALPLWLVRRHA